MLEINELNNLKIFHKKKSRSAITYKRVSKKSHFAQSFRKQREISSINNEITIYHTSHTTPGPQLLRKPSHLWWEGGMRGTYTPPLCKHHTTSASQATFGGTGGMVVCNAGAPPLWGREDTTCITTASQATYYSATQAHTTQLRKPRITTASQATNTTFGGQGGISGLRSCGGNADVVCNTGWLGTPSHNQAVPKVCQKQYQRLIRIAYYQAGKTVVQTLLPQHPPVSLIILNPIGFTSSTSADIYVPSDPNSITQCYSSLESRLIGFYGGKATSQLFEYEYESTSRINSYPSASIATPQKKQNWANNVSFVEKGVPQFEKSRSLEYFQRGRKAVGKKQYNWKSIQKGASETISTNKSSLFQKSQDLIAKLKNKREFYNFSTILVRVLSSYEKKYINKVDKSLEKNTLATTPLTVHGLPSFALPTLPYHHSFASHRPQTTITNITTNTTSTTFGGKGGQGGNDGTAGKGLAKLRVAKHNGVIKSDSYGGERRDHCTSGESNAKNSWSFAGAGNNFFQSNIGIIEIQTATRLANIMVNNLNFYYCNPTFVGKINNTLPPLIPHFLKLRYVSNTMTTSTLNTPQLRKPTPLSSATQRGGAPKVVRGMGLLTSGSRVVRDNGGIGALTSRINVVPSLPKRLAQQVGFAKLIGSVMQSGNVGKINDETIKVSTAIINSVDDTTNLSTFIINKVDEPRNQKRSNQKNNFWKNSQILKNNSNQKRLGKNIFLTHLFKPFCEDENSLIIKKSSNTSSTRISIENVGTKQFLNIGIFVNSFQFSNVQRDRFYLGWFRLYLPDIEATAFLKNVANYFFNLGLQTFIRPSISKLNPRLCFSTFDLKLACAEKLFKESKTSNTTPFSFATLTPYHTPCTIFDGKLVRWLGGMGEARTSFASPALHTTSAYPTGKQATFTTKGGTGDNRDFPIPPEGLAKLRGRGISNVVYNPLFFGTKKVNRIQKLPVKVKTVLITCKRPKEFIASSTEIQALLHTIEDGSKPFGGMGLQTMKEVDKDKPKVSSFISFADDKKLMDFSTKLIDLHNVFLCFSEGNITNNLRIGIGLLRNIAKRRNQTSITTFGSTASHVKDYSFLLKSKNNFNKNGNKNYIPSFASPTEGGYVSHQIGNKFNQINVKREQLSYLDVSSFLLLEKQIFPLGSIIETSNRKTASPPYHSVFPNQYEHICFATPAYQATSALANIPYPTEVGYVRYIQQTTLPQTKGLAKLRVAKQSGELPCTTKGGKMLAKQSGLLSFASPNIAYQRSQCGGEQKTGGIANSNVNNVSNVEKELVYRALINNCFTKAFLLINQNRQLLDYFVDYLIRFQVLRQHQILYLFSAILLNCKK